MKGARALASGMLVLVAICAVPAISAAQDSGTPADSTTTTTTTPTATTPGDGTAGAPDAAPTGSSAGDLSPITGKPVRDPSSGSIGAPAADPAAAASASSPSPGGKVTAHKAASASVTMGDFFFSAASVTIAVGDTVTWHNSGQAPHTATANDGSFDTGTVNSGGSASHTFNSAGTFSYICTIHPNMKGTVRVLSSSGDSGGSGGVSSSSSGTSESSAVASPNAAGTSTTLPMTGMAVGALALVGAALLASGLIARRADDESRRRWFSLF
jgi:plastocyanin